MSGGATSGSATIDHADTSSQASVNNSGRTYIQDITLDGAGHVTALASATETVTNSDTNYYLSNITNSGNTYTWVMSGTTDRSIAFGSNAFTSYAAPTYTSAIGNATSSATGLMTSTYAGKLDGIENGATADQTSVSGNAGSATVLATARTIGGVSFNGSANINLPGVNAAGNQNTSGTAANLSGTPNIAIGTLDAATGTFVSSITAGGDITAFYSASDLALKENIKPISNSLNKVLTLDGINWTYKNDGRSMTGLIAQQLEKVLPDAVYEADIMGDKPHKAIRYGNVVGLLVEAIKELKEEIDILKEK
jgi:hypothetical protein